MNAARTPRAGFTLIEVLAATAVLVVLLLALLRIFGDANQLYLQGNRMVLRNNAGRAAMDLVARDLEGAIVNQRFAMIQKANQVNNDYDELYFMTMTGDTPSDGRSFRLVRYAVVADTSKGYNSYKLKRYVSSYTTATIYNVDPLTTADKQWWKDFDDIAGDPQIGEDLMDNIVRFDVYVHNRDGDIIGRNLGAGPGGSFIEWDSTRLDNHPIDTPFGFVDLYLQVTSDQTMRRAALLRQAGNDPGARRLLDQDSNVLLRRVIPILGSAELVHPQWIRP
jgi:prepilin-type N-terminal cleavage/methylation domain-containing protein